MSAVRLGGSDDRLVNGPQPAVWPPGELGRPGGEGTAYAAAVEVGPFFGAAGPANGQGCNASATGTASGARARWGHQAPLGPAALASAPTGQGGPVTRLAHRPLRPAGTGRPVLAAMGAADGPPGRATHADRPADGHEIAGPVPPAHRAGGHRAVEAAAAQLALAVVGTPGDRPYPSTAAAAPFGPRGTDRAERLPRQAPAVDHLDHPTTATGGGVVAGPTARAEPGVASHGQLRVGPPAARTNRLGQGCPPGPELPHQPAGHGRRPDGQGARAGPSERASTDSALALGAAAVTAELTALVPSPGQASATREVTRSLQVCWRAGLTRSGPPWPGGDGRRAPHPEPAAPWGRSAWCSLAPARPARPGSPRARRRAQPGSAG